MQGGVRRPRDAINWDSKLLQVWICATPQWTTKTKTGAECDEWNASIMTGKLTACCTHTIFLKCPYYNLHWQDYRQINRYQTRDKYATQGHNNVYDTALAVWCLVTLPQAGESVWKVTLRAREREHAFVIYSAWDAAARLHTWQGAERTARQEN